MIKKFNLKSEFVKYIVVLMSGTVMAQLVSYLLAPVISRIYLPEETAELAIFIRIVSVGAAIATLRYEPALPITKTDSHSFRLYQFALRSTVIVTLVSLVLILVPAGMSSSISGVIFYALIPLMILFSAIYNLGTNWSIRNKYFKSISFSKITNSLFGGSFKVLFGWMNMGYVGLLLASTIGMFASILWFVRDFFRAKKKFQIRSNSPRNAVLARQYSEFPTINLPHVLMDLGRDLLVAVLLLKLFTKEDLGLYDHSYRMLRIPLVFIGMAIGQVFFQHCAEKVNKNEDIVPLLRKSVGVLALLSVIPFAVVFFYGEELFAFVFGENWRGAGTFSRIMAPWFLVNFIASPISTLPLILKKQKVFFQLAIAGTILMILTMTIPPLVYNASMYTTLWIVSLTQAGYLVFVIFKKFEFARKHNAR